MTITNPRILALFGFRILDGSRCKVSQPITLWLRCLWWRCTQ